MTEFKNIVLPELTQADVELLRELSNACGVSGNEKEVRKIVRREVTPFADTIEVDALGNLIATKKAKTAEFTRVLISAHMDEVGFMLVEETDPGLYRFRVVGGIDPRALAGKAVLVGPEHLHGVIGACPIHLTTAEQRSKTIGIDDLRIDIGAENKSVKPGMFAYFATEFSEMGGSVCGKALDDRLGVINLIKLLSMVPENVELIAAFTVQEEIGARGASVAAFNRKPDCAIVIDSTPAMDLPKWNDEEITLYKSKLGEGPAIYTSDSGTLNDPRLIGLMLKLADSYGIPCQLRQPANGGTDAGAIHLTQSGIPTVSVSVPGRYAHTAAGLARKSDWQAHLQLVYAALANINKEMFSQPR